jgi:hypothetical protein
VGGTVLSLSKGQRSARRSVGRRGDGDDQGEENGADEAGDDLVYGGLFRHGKPAATLFV